MTVDRAMPIDLTISPAGLDAIKAREGLVTHAYEDQGGTRTIGYGHTGGVRAGERITEQQATELLLADCNHAKMAIVRTIHVPLTQSEFDALTSFVYNVGEEKFARSNVAKAVNSGNIDDAADMLLRWCNVDHKFSKGLYKRRKDEAAQLRGL